MAIKSFYEQSPIIYAYSTPGVVYHDGWLKIGKSKRNVDVRIGEQVHVADITYHIEWQRPALFYDGEYDEQFEYKFHHYLTQQKGIENKKGTEWFRISKEDSLKYFEEFASKTIPASEEMNDYSLRDEQGKAVNMTKTYFSDGGSEFLWNAKPRFGKTLSTYDLIREAGYKKVLVVTNRPSISNSWAEEFYKFISWRGGYCFVCDNDALKGKQGVMSRDEYLRSGLGKPFIAFESLQNLKGSIYFGGSYKKLEWMAKEYIDGNGIKQNGIHFDLLVVDEAQEGVETMKTEQAFRNIARDHTLYLSGTPFKALASDQFNENQIFNWSYADEQAAKEGWDEEHEDEENPYEDMPQIVLYTYQLSNMIAEEVKKGAQIDEDNVVDYAFDLNEFFATDPNTNQFIHKEEIEKFLHSLSTQEKYPFSTPELRNELSHTLWILNRVASVKALAEMLKNDPVFKEYEIVIAAGDGRLESDDEIINSYDKVKEAIANNEKTITLSVGQLTVGVTIPEWSGVLMLCNMQSPSSYMQAAFRIQNPCSFMKNGKVYRKEYGYIFDFDPARTLIVYDDFANNLSLTTLGGRGSQEDRKENIKKLLNFFPVIGEDSEGSMVQLDANQVLSIPRKIKSQEVVRRGFMCNFLFQNISNIFGAPHVVEEILNKLPIAHEEMNKNKNSKVSNVDQINVDENGEVEVSKEIVIGKSQDLFGSKYYETVNSTILPEIQDFGCDTGLKSADKNELESRTDELIGRVKNSVKDNVITPIANSYDLKKRDSERLQKQFADTLDEKFQKIHNDYLQQSNIAQAELSEKYAAARTSEERIVARETFDKRTAEIVSEFQQEFSDMLKDTIESTPNTLIEELEHRKAESEKNTIEDTVRDHLRGFARTIPSFIMAYGDGELTLQNFDEKTESEVFKEVTGITIDEFKFLRDGGTYYDSETGHEEYFKGQLFDEIVFNDSIAEFWNKKKQLANYFDESQTEDIFDYIPPQKTNQIFTPRSVVIKMVDELETENPGCFDNPNNTFADLYMKSGLYITEIVKRLFRSEAIKNLYPDNNERIHHILEKQVYGMAPTRIIYLIATNYILGFDENLKLTSHNFVEADAAEAAKNGTLQELVDESFEGVKLSLI